MIHGGFILVKKCIRMRSITLFNKFSGKLKVNHNEAFFLKPLRLEKNKVLKKGLKVGEVFNGH